MGKCYFLTGAGGRVGHKFVEILCKRNIDDVTELKLFDVKFLDEVKREQALLCQDANITVEWIVGSVTDADVLRASMTGADVVIHMAAVVDFLGVIPKSTLWNVNFKGTINVIEACCHCNVKCCIYTSSVEGVGPNPSRDPVKRGNEDTDYKYKPLSTYAFTKHEAEKQILAANGRRLATGNCLTTCALRMCGIFGGKDPFLEFTIKQVRVKKRLDSISSRKALHNRIYIDNAAWCHVMAAKRIQEKRELIGGNFYYLGDETPEMSCTRFNYTILKPFGYTISREPIAPYYLLLAVSKIQCGYSRCLKYCNVKKTVTLTPYILKLLTTQFTFSHEKFERHFNYKPLFTWEEAVQKTREDMKLLIESLWL